MTPLPDLVSDACIAVERACAVCRHVQRDLDRIRAITKDDRSPVTIADYASQAVVARTLAMSHADTGSLRLVAEESAAALKAPEHAPHLAAVVEALNASGAWAGATADEVIEAVERGSGTPPAANSIAGWWTLDPIDGTKGFLRGQQYCVALAFMQKGQPMAGVMGCPNLPGSNDAPLDRADTRGTVYAAWKHGGAAELQFEPPERAPKRADPRQPYQIIDFMTTRAIRHTGFDAERGVRLAESFEAAHSDHDASAQVVGQLGRAGPPARLDSQCKYAIVARGQADLYLRLPVKPGYVERIWDHAAGSLIAQEAGLIVSDLNGAPLDFGRGRGLEKNVGVVVAPPELHPRVLQAAQAARPPQPEHS